MNIQVVNMSVASLNKCLIVIRVGADASMVACTDRKARNWDVAISTYSDVNRLNSEAIEYRHHYIGGKWDGIFNFFEKNSHVLDIYDYFWFPDDDLDLSSELCNDVVSYVVENEFDLAQPALTYDSYHSHRLLVRVPFFSHRLSNFVELMMPLLTKKLLLKMLPMFEGTWSGVGLDWVWSYEVQRTSGVIAILDKYPVRHSRPLNQHLRESMALQGVSALEEREQNLAKYKFEAPAIYPIIFSGVSSQGHIIGSFRVIAAIMAVSYAMNSKKIAHKNWNRKALFNFFKRQFFQKKYL